MGTFLLGINVLDALANQTQISIEELVQLSAVDNEFFSHEFFPKTVRQSSPEFHGDIWGLLESLNRLINILVFRGGAKTSILRMYTAKRIALGLAHTILYIGKSEGHAARSIKWIKRVVEFNAKFNQVFRLRAGAKWQDTEAEIYRGDDTHPVWIMGTGITGSVRGINQDDFRPDLIVVDDSMNEENSATPDMRNKISDLIYGALIESLAPASESPDAKLVMLQTPQNREDASMLALKDSAWKSARFGCWTRETEGLALHQQESIWPSRWPSEVLRKEKQQAIDRNKLSLWLREKECTLVSPETAAFKENWLKYYELLPEHMVKVMVIDPVPPPSEIQIAKGLRGKDFEALAVVGRHKGNYYLLEYSLNRGHDPSWTIAEFFRLAFKYSPRRIVVESVAYQRTLSWLLKQAMRHQKQYWVIKETDDKRKKFDKIVDGLNGPASNGAVFVRRDQREFIAQFVAYPDVPNDDLIEAVAIGVTELQGNILAQDDEDTFDYTESGDELPTLTYQRGAP
jgi:phage terminase large subunit-like protein